MSALLTAFAACCGAQKEWVAKVGSITVTRKELTSYLEGNAGASFASIDARVASALTDQMLEELVILEAGRRRGLINEVPESAFARSRTARLLLGELCGKMSKSKLVAPETPQDTAAVRKVRQMIFSTKERADEAYRKVATGESFEKVSRQMSEAPNADSGGNLGLVEKGTLPEEVEGIIFSLQPGQVSKPVKGPGGWHIFQVLPLEGEPPVSVQPSRLDFTACIEGLASDIDVKVNTAALWFTYTGRYSGEGSR